MNLIIQLMNKSRRYRENKLEQIGFVFVTAIALFAIIVRIISIVLGLSV